MSNPNLHYTAFTQSGGNHVTAVTGVARDDGLGGMADQYLAATQPAPGDRITRRRHLTAAEAEHEIAGWIQGARALAAPKGWRAWQRERGDASTGARRVQRMAVSDATADGAPCDGINWSVPAPVSRGDEQHWHALMDPREAEADRPPVPFMGWTA